MAAIATEGYTPSIRRINRDLRPLAAVKVWKGSKVAVNAAGFFLAATGLAAEKTLNAVFTETVDNTGGAAGDKQAEVMFLRERTVHLQVNNGANTLTVAHRERTCYQVDDQTVSSLNTLSPSGNVYDVTTEGVWVEGNF